MNWMIDGAYGHLYRRSMGFPELEAAVDEWAVERAIGRKPRSAREPLKRLAKYFAVRLASAIQSARAPLATKEIVS